MLLVTITTTSLAFFSTASAKSNRIARFEDKSGEIHYGLVEENTITQLEGDFANIANGKLNMTDKTYDLSQVSLMKKRY